MNKISKISAIVAMSCSFISNASFAAAFSNETTATADIVFNAPTNPLTLTITPDTGLVAGLIPSNTKVATVSAVPQSPAIVGVRFTPNTLNMALDPAEKNFADISGANDPGNILAVNLMGDVDGFALSEVSVGTDTYLFDDVSNGANVFNGSLVTYVNADQQIGVDTYTVSLDAAIYNL